MLRTRLFALGFLACGGCLGPMADDAAGYSPRILESNASIPNAADDFLFNSRIDDNDNVDSGPIALQTAYALGTKVRFWDLGKAKSSATPAWQFFYCDAAGQPIADGPELHPLLIDSLPGDGDYTQFWVLQRMCVTDRYNGQLITSTSALSDAIEIGLVAETPADELYLHLPVVTQDVSLEKPTGSLAQTKSAFYRGTRVRYLDFGPWGAVPAREGRLNTANAYQVVRDGEMKPERIVLDNAPMYADGVATKGYTPLLYLATVVVSAEADMEAFVDATDLVMEDDSGKLAPAQESVLSVEVSRDRVAWPVAAVEASP